MAKIVQCSACQASLTLPDESVGQTVSCPKCSASWVVSDVAPASGIPAGAPSAMPIHEQAIAEGSPPGKTALPSVDAASQKTRSGLKLIFIGLLLIFAGITTIGLLLRFAIWPRGGEYSDMGVLLAFLSQFGIGAGLLSFLFGLGRVVVRVVRGRKIKS